MNEYIHVGLDVHLDSITAAILGRDGEQPEAVRLPGDLMKVRRLFRRLSAKGPVRACYEASGAGFVVQRVLAAGCATTAFSTARARPPGPSHTATGFPSPSPPSPESSAASSRAY